MTSVFRCSGGHSSLFDFGKRESMKFLDDVYERAMLSSFLPFPNPIMEIFNRGPIRTGYQSRFGPVGQPKNPLYTAIDQETTFYEYGFHLLNSMNLLNEEIKISCYEMTVEFPADMANPAKSPNVHSILSTSTNYTAAHTWLLGIHPFPDVVEYQSVRHPSPDIPTRGMNYAIYHSKTIKWIHRQIPLLLRMDKKYKNISVYGLAGEEMATLKPVFNKDQN